MPLHRWFDVLVVAEQVGGIVLVLQGDQALVALAIGRPDQVCTFLDFTPDVIDVYAAAQLLDFTPDVQFTDPRCYGAALPPRALVST